MLPVAEGQHRHLGTDHTLLNDHRGARFPKFFVLHHLPGGLLRLLHGGGDHNPLAQSQAVGLDHNGRALLPDVGQSPVQVGEGLIFCGGDVVFFHQLFGKGLAGLDDGGVGPGAEGGDARRLQGVHHPQSQGVVRSHHDKVHGVLLGPLHHPVHVGGLDGDTLGHLGDAPVARGAVELRYLGALGQLPADGVLPAASAYD